MPSNKRNHNKSSRSQSQISNATSTNNNSDDISGVSFSGMSRLTSLPCPNIPHDGRAIFEVIIFAYTFVSMLLQYLHLYKSVWWLPHSYTNSALNAYLIDYKLLVFITLVIGRRIIWSVVKKLLRFVVPAVWMTMAVISFRRLTILAILCLLSYVGKNVIIMTPPVSVNLQIVNLVYIGYPFFLYIILFGFNEEPFLELTSNSQDGKIKIFQDKTGFYRSYGGFASGANSSSTPEAIRNEVEFMKDDFNHRLKQIMFNSIINAYFATFIPCCLAPVSLHYEVGWVGRHILLVWIGCATLLMTQLYPSSYVHMMHKVAVHLGSWSKLEDSENMMKSFNSNATLPWSPFTIWPQDSIARHGKAFYRANTFSNIAEPGNSLHNRFFTVFYDPSCVSLVLLVLQSSVVLAQHCSLLFSYIWYQLISESILLFANYYVLYKLIRDYNVLWRIYSIEVDISDKIS